MHGQRTLSIQQILSTLPKSRDLANSMRLLASVCRIGRSLLPAIQRLVALTLLGKEPTESVGNPNGTSSNISDSFGNSGGTSSRSISSGASGTLSDIGNSFGKIGGSSGRSLSSSGGSSVAGAADASCQGREGGTAEGLWREVPDESVCAIKLCFDYPLNPLTLFRLGQPTSSRAIFCSILYVCALFSMG